MVFHAMVPQLATRALIFFYSEDEDTVKYIKSISVDETLGYVD
jgi:hypothetical protein